MGKLYYYLLPINIGLTSTELKTNKSSVSILLNALEYTKGMTVDVLNIQIKGILSLSLSLQISCSSTDGHYSLLYPFPHLLSPSSILAMAVDSTLPNTFQIQPPSSDPLLPPPVKPTALSRLGYCFQWSPHFQSVCAVVTWYHRPCPPLEN